MRADALRAGALAVAASALLAGCSAGGGPASPSTGASASATPTARPFTVLTTEAPHSLDPAEARTGPDATAALDLFQRVLVLPSGTSVPKPDAGDCLFREPTVYECTIVKGLTFSNGHPLTASDVKFSIDRAKKLNAAGSSIRLFDALQAVEVSDDQTVRFHLAWPDSQFGVALATPAASIVDEQVYEADKARPDAVGPVGSGPFTLGSSDASGMTFVRNQAYAGATKPLLPLVRLSFAPDSATVEQAMVDASADVVWRGLDTAADARIASGATRPDYVATQLAVQRLRRLVWNPAGPAWSRADVRAAVAAALQADRTATSLVPPSVAGSVPSFTAGGRPTVAPISGARVALTLTYAGRAPGMADVARQLRDRLEAGGGVSVQVQPDAASADLTLTDTPAWANTALAWLQPYLDAPLPGSQVKLQQLSQTARSGDAGARDAVLGEIQQQAAVDATVLPVSLSPETVYTRPAVKIAPDAYGPAWQLGLWGFST